VPEPGVTKTESELNAEHNALRAEHGLSPLNLEPHLLQAARAHASYMARVRRMGHFGIGDGTPWSRITATGYVWSAAGENVAWNQPDVETVMADWMSSLGHRANILSSAYTQMGAAVGYDDKGEPYWCVVFASPSTAGSIPLVASPPEPYSEADYGYLVPPATTSPEPSK
jgi:uncharacterized protein YkwD